MTSDLSNPPVSESDHEHGSPKDSTLENRKLLLNLLPWAVAGVIILAGCLAILFVEPYTSWIWTTTVFGLVGGAALAIASSRRRFTLPKGWLIAGIVFAILVRLAMILWPSHELSDDIYRYHWDGKVLVNGINPYLYSPDDSHLASIRDHGIDLKVNHPYNLTCYPPGAQFVFALGYLISPNSLTGLKLLFMLSELAGWLILLKLLVRKKRPRFLVLLVAWMPLGIVEAHLPGHVDPLAIPWLCLFLLMLDRKQAVAAALALALAVQFRPLFLLFAPVAALQFSWQKASKAFLAFILVTITLYLPFLSAGDNLFSSTWLMAKYWKFNASISFLEAFFLSDETLRMVAAVAVSAVTLFSAWWFRKKPVVAMQAALIGFVAFSPTVFAWYLTGALVLLAIEDEAALLVLVVLLPMSELIMIPYTTHGLWELPLWVRMAQYVPFYSMLVWEAVSKKGIFQQQ